jgi:hypothetical protein
MMKSNEALRAQIGTRSERLRHIAEELKTELFGIDEVIDRVIDAVRAWYVLWASRASLLMRLLVPGCEGLSAPLRRMCSK